MENTTTPTYLVEKVADNDGVVDLKLGFGAPAQNDVIVRDAVAAVAALNLQGGKLVRLNGPASLPVACAIAHAVGHIFSAVAVFDPKMSGYVVAISHNPEILVGTIIS